ncbi:hypothetical protein POG23_22900 [Limnoraphis robusta]|nr:hypothetical protein [Limnoraphis robusta]
MPPPPAAKEFIEASTGIISPAKAIANRRLPADIPRYSPHKRDGNAIATTAVVSSNG